jgi:hypothetical protein
MQRISDDWWIGIDESYRTRVEDGSLVFWRSERTVWINVWKDGDGRSTRERLDGWVGERNVGATDLFRRDDNGLLRFAYLLEEPEESGGLRLGVYSYTVGESSTVQMACYFDLKEDLDWATAVTRSLSYRHPEPSLKVDEPIGENGHLVLASERVIGPGGEPVLVAYRESAANEQDSGWRFFHGDEDEEFTADPLNVSLCPLSTFLVTDPLLRLIINSPAGTAWERSNPSEPWSPAGGTLPEEKAEWAP